MEDPLEQYHKQMAGIPAPPKAPSVREQIEQHIKEIDRRMDKYSSSDYQVQLLLAKSQALQALAYARNKGV
jgi:hypothetical protein